MTPRPWRTRNRGKLRYSRRWAKRGFQIPIPPIVDRARADLVATINQPVCALLRAYVAGAIERAIENWRDQQHPERR